MCACAYRWVGVVHYECCVGVEREIPQNTESSYQVSFNIKEAVAYVHLDHRQLYTKTVLRCIKDCLGISQHKIDIPR